MLLAAVSALLGTVGGSVLAAEPEVLILEPPAAPGAMGSNLFVSGDDVHLTWLEPVPDERGAWRLRWSLLDAANEWSEPRTIAQGVNWFVNWADFPALVVDGRGAMVAHWLEKSGPATYAYDIILARSLDQGRTWTRLGKVHDDFTQTEHGFVSFVPDAEGAWVFWLDGREMSGGHDGDNGDMSLRVAFVGNEIDRRAILDPRVCECCPTAAATTDLGPIVAYRDRSADEVRDISVVRWTGEEWSEPISVHDDGWQIAGCPVNGPALAASGSTVAVAWFTAAGGRSRVLAAFSNDSGATFGNSIVVDEAPDGPQRDGPLGRVDVVFDEQTGEAVVSWLAVDRSVTLDNYAAGDAAIRLRRISPDGRLGDPFTLAPTTTARSSGFPRLTTRGTDFIISWTEDSRPTRLWVGVVPGERVRGPK